MVLQTLIGNKNARGTYWGVGGCQNFSFLSVLPRYRLAPFKRAGS
jgi:hypothetical protein